MREEKKWDYVLEPEDYGPLWRWVRDTDITDIDYNGTSLWITDSRNIRRQESAAGISAAFVERFCALIANQVSCQFNKVNNLLEAETDCLRISIVHESAAISGRSICIRKSLPICRITCESAVQTGYCSERILNFLIHCVRAQMNLVFIGEPGCGKTEAAKFFSTFIPAQDRVITIEDTPEWHYREMNPGKDCVEIRVGPHMTYTKAIRTSLRQNPRWLMLSEARSTEVKSLLECLSTGVHGITTLHADDVRKVPDRILNMMPDRTDADRLENDVYAFLDTAVLIRRVWDPVSGTVRRAIDQIGILSRDPAGNHMVQILEGGQENGAALPEDFLERMRRNGITDPYRTDGPDRAENRLLKK